VGVQTILEKNTAVSDQQQQQGIVKMITSQFGQNQLGQGNSARPIFDIFLAELHHCVGRLD